MTIGVIGDLHLEPSVEKQVFETFEATLKKFEEFDIDKLVVVGDVIQETDPETDERILARFVERLATAEYDFRIVFGNHDVKTLSTGEVESIVGHDNWLIDTDEELCFLDSSAPHLSDGRDEIPKAQVQALTDHFDSLDNVLIFVHHPIPFGDSRGNYWFSETPEQAFCGNKESILSRLDPDKVAAVINAHLHEWGVVEYRDIMHFTLDAFTHHQHPERTSGGFTVINRGTPLTITQHRSDGTEHHITFPM